MEIIHVSAECYPVAKAGGLGDVVGALPKYQCKSGDIAKVIMPMYRTKFLYENDWTVDFKGSANLGNWYFDFTVIKEPSNKLGFDLFLIDINGLLDRQKIYGYDDDAERFTAFQIAVVSWISSWEHQPDVVHCHDHHTALIPFMMKYCYDFQHLAAVSTVVTIHNGQYQGWMGWDKSLYIPRWDLWKRGMLDWAGSINPLASGVKCADKVTTVSWSYMDELRENANGLEALFEFEKGKCVGILNGIDNEVWNPSTDTYIENRFTVKTVTKGKEQNKKILCDQFGLDITKPLFVFIGRLVGEKAADILPDAIRTAIHQTQGNACFLILGSGETSIEWELQQMTNEYQGIYNAYIGYNEQLSHLIYAGADFLLMPSRVEPCGLNQMYAMRYGTVPVVRSTGGLKDTVTDMGDTDGFGIRFNNATIDDLAYSIGRGVSVYQDKKHMEWMRKYMMQIDHSWESTVSEYRQVYQSLK
ncbi:MAG: glycogen synthase [Sphingobacteriia bacterium 24-36-13]|jgi:starch synthase|uniref:glycogen synthase n=1 Tax=Sediminibacterium sp. TaxID=1917865 RepID=UPI000BCDE4DC|nr:glycogen/starch synthase [Sediminibacterium sp.]OYY09327.1 MAG: glycogen synthase [Sphingobacteriia bacterium 35-36-14]OYZ54404.1 MAG: glycogen synthase [Sphingobacteriia bacterium 24-36-13]OZA65179.1 MAG: glycogen synthase [Sphingobacteriia bacterium 39-36-14]HQS24292.1 glycogen/starch synthase [Sediminibacterium sp.]HQS34616.1 glycogen/starch synthase [Sediminibacterium sp.]